ncbi:hypothetical protein C6H88_04630 [Chlamydia muridarum str. Nigg]|nr:hypothetical protein [Chlamydia muridarum]UFW26045.1 hypothetical protein FTM99_04785 [Chlamydia trachomatis]AVM88614.1 hypothetical protein C6H96_04625 [Chlamydia muridarum str. Nigg]AVM89515.1 hypothetical protein C6H95_04625 [Chlamydia muridarum str. Nigg]AVM90414.1 hypothetical protein C6H94_04620 [Chlamydia muridarum str. Nigg]AVM91308.1 hypothetical protein C6H93_04620 [Chlamydia muridarum str. Nigg]
MEDSMIDGIQTCSFGATHRLTAKSTVSLEMPLATHNLQEGASASAKLEADFIRAEQILAEMQEIRSSLEQSLETLIPRE